jgi:molybdopterin converting factor small subunit
MIKLHYYTDIAEKYQFNKHIWEGWTVGDFVAELEPSLDRIMDFSESRAYNEPAFRTKSEIKNWVRNNLPYTTKALNEVTKYFVDKYNGMTIFDSKKPDCMGKLKL